MPVIQAPAQGRGSLATEAARGLGILLAPDIAPIGPALGQPFVEQDAAYIAPIGQLDINEIAPVGIRASGGTDAIAAGKQIAEAIPCGDGQRPLALASGFGDFRRIDRHKTPFLTAVSSGVAVDDAIAMRVGGT